MLTILITESILSPDATSTIDAMHSIDKAVATSYLSVGAFHILVTEEARRHTRPESEDHESKEIANSEGTAPGLKKQRASSGSFRSTQGLSNLRFINSVSRSGVVVEPNEEGNSAWNVYEGVHPVDHGHQLTVTKENPLY